MGVMHYVKYIAIALIIIGALNWGLVGAFHYNVVAAFFGDASVVTRIIYGLVGLSGLYKLYMMLNKK